jgi:hypothetical protein
MSKSYLLASHYPLYRQGLKSGSLVLVVIINLLLNSEALRCDVTWSAGSFVTYVRSGWDQATVSRYIWYRIWGIVLVPFWIGWQRLDLQTCTTKRTWHVRFPALLFCRRVADGY